MLPIRLRLQSAEALGPVNQWYCSEAHGRPINDPNLLWTHFVKKGGAHDFAKRYDEATGPINRWYCSQFYRRDVRDPEILWDYYMKYLPDGRSSSQNKPAGAQHEMHIAG